MELDENNGSQVEQSGTCDVGDEIPPLAIRRMGVGFILPIEEPLVAGPPPPPPLLYIRGRGTP